VQVTPRATCRSLHGVCTSPRICTAQNGVHPINGTGCPAGEVCCS
jgi:hypothetical protein